MANSASAKSRKKSRLTSNRYKLVVVGDGACGKTSLLTVFYGGKFPTDHIPTIFETTIATLKLGDEDVRPDDHQGQQQHREIELALWDTAGQEEYDKLRPLSYPNTDVVLICFSIDRPESLTHVESQWATEVRHFCRGVPVILVGNKTDLRDSPEVLEALRQEGADRGTVTREETRATAGRIRAEAFVECSALRGHGVDEVFRVAARAAIARRRNAGKIAAKIRQCVLL